MSYATYGLTSDIDLALGRLSGLLSGTKFGRNSDIDTSSAPEDVWEVGGDYTGHPLSFTPETVSVSSSSALDDSVGTGARTIRIIGLESDASTNYTSEDIALNGTSPVVSSKTWWRVNRAYVLTAGSGAENAGVITGNSTTATANVFFGIPIGSNQTQVGAFTVPYRKKMILKRLRINITRSNGSPGSANVTLRSRSPGGVYRSIRSFELQTGSPTDFTAFSGDVLEEGCDVKFRVESVSDNNTICDGAFEYIIVDG